MSGAEKHPERASVPAVDPSRSTPAPAVAVAASSSGQTTPGEPGPGVAEVIAFTNAAAENARPAELALMKGRFEAAKASRDEWRDRAELAEASVADLRSSLAASERDAKRWRTIRDYLEVERHDSLGHNDAVHVVLRDDDGDLALIGEDIGVDDVIDERAPSPQRDQQ